MNEDPCWNMPQANGAACPGLDKRQRLDIEEFSWTCTSRLPISAGRNEVRAYLPPLQSSDPSVRLDVPGITQHNDWFSLFSVFTCEM